MSTYISFTKLKHLILINRGSIYLGELVEPNSIRYYGYIIYRIKKYSRLYLINIVIEGCKNVMKNML
jgi:hypothetical protein